MKSIKQFINEQDKRLEFALLNVRKFSNHNNAETAMHRQKYVTGVLLGDDGKYWVPTTNHELAILLKAGYERLSTNK